MWGRVGKRFAKEGDWVVGTWVVAMRWRDTVGRADRIC